MNKKQLITIFLMVMILSVTIIISYHVGFVNGDNKPLITKYKYEEKPMYYVQDLSLLENMTSCEELVEVWNAKQALDDHNNMVSR